MGIRAVPIGVRSPHTTEGNSMPIEIPDSDALPINRRKSRRRPKQAPATQAERDALEIVAIKAEFDWSNDEWAETWLPWIRVAAMQVGGDQDRLKDGMRRLVKSGEAPNVLEGLTRTKMHLEALHKLVDAALTRSFLVLE